VFPAKRSTKSQVVHVCVIVSEELSRGGNNNDYNNNSNDKPQRESANLSLPADVVEISSFICQFLFDRNLSPMCEKHNHKYN